MIVSRTDLGNSYETTVFHADGSRTVIGQSFSTHYAPDGTATMYGVDNYPLPVRPPLPMGGQHSVPLRLAA